MSRQTVSFHAHHNARLFSNLKESEVREGTLMDLIYKIQPNWDAMKSTASSNMPHAEIRISYNHNRFVGAQSDVCANVTNMCTYYSSHLSSSWFLKTNFPAMKPCPPNQRAKGSVALVLRPPSLPLNLAQRGVFGQGQSSIVHFNPRTSNQPQPQGGHGNAR